MTYDEAQTIIRRVLAAEFDHATYDTVARNRPQTPDQLGRCMCAHDEGFFTVNDNH